MAYSVVPGRKSVSDIPVFSTAVFELILNLCIIRQIIIIVIFTVIIIIIIIRV